MSDSKTFEVYEATKVEQGLQIPVEDNLVVEEMLSISINGKPYTITMRTPGFEEEHTRGILLTEDVYVNRNDNPFFVVTGRNDKGMITAVNVTIPADQVQAGIDQQRNLLSVSSCGMCGKYDMSLNLDGELKSDQKLDHTLVPNMFATMSSHQQNFAQTGGCHAAALCTIHGELLDCKEDIGRHNAVDKVIGSLLMQHRLNEAAVLLVSGRVSYEIISKAFKAGIPFLCSVSAPSGMAVDYCRQCGITLLAFCRGDKFTIYSHPERVTA